MRITMKRTQKILLGIFSLGVIMLGVGGAVMWTISFHPAEIQTEPITCSGQPPVLEPGRVLKILNYNVQFMAGKGYVFFFDMPNFDGPDERPSAEVIGHTIEHVARIIREESPDIILLQEVDDGAKRTDYEDQLARLLDILPPEYACHASAFYWKAPFVPHSRIMGAVGMKLSTISKYRLTAATRHQLALVPTNPFFRQFSLKRAVLETHFPVRGRDNFVVLNVHAEAFAEGSDVVQRQMEQIDALLRNLTRAGHPWVIGGDFNALPPISEARTRLPAAEQGYYRPHSEMKLLLDEYRSVPSLRNVGGPNYADWFTYFPNTPLVNAPDRTIDYILFSDGIELRNAAVKQDDALSVSDHLPVIIEFTLKNSE